MGGADAETAWAFPHRERKTFLYQMTRQGPMLLSHLKHLPCVTLSIIFLLNFFPADQPATRPVTMGPAEEVGLGGTCSEHLRAGGPEQWAIPLSRPEGFTRGWSTEAGSTPGWREKGVRKAGALQLGPRVAGGQMGDTGGAAEEGTPLRSRALCRQPSVHCSGLVPAGRSRLWDPGT